MRVFVEKCVEKRYNAREVTRLFGKKNRKHRFRVVANVQKQRERDVRHAVLMGISGLVFAVSAFLLVRYGIMTVKQKALEKELRSAYQAEQTAAGRAAENALEAADAAVPVTASLPEIPFVSFKPSAVTTPLPISAKATMVPRREEPVAAVTPEPGMQERFVSLYKKNKDVVAWLKVEAVPEIDFPITKRDNDFYMDHDFYGRKSASGTVFMDMSCQVLPLSENTILHGHNMKNGTMFGKLKTMMQLENFRAKPLVYFDTLYENTVFVPYAVSVVSIDPGQPHFFPLIMPTFQTEDDRDSYIATLKKYSLYSLPTDVLVGDDLLTLTTCHGNEDHERLIVGLRRLRPNETVEEMKNSILQQTRLRGKH